MNSKVLVTGVGGDVGQSVVSVIRKRFPEFEIIGSDMSLGHAGEFIVDKFFVSPRATEVDFKFWIEQIISNNSIDFVVPTSDDEIAQMISVDHWKVPILVPNRESISIGQDKLATSKFLEFNELLFPMTKEIDQTKLFSFPCIVKPRRGQGSKNVSICYSEADLNYFKKQGTELILQELLTPSEMEITCGVYRNRKGETAVIALRRKLVGGATTWVQVVYEESIEEYCKSIANKLNLQGSINVQLILTKLGPIAFEINSRFSSTVAIRDELGFTDLVWSIQENFLNQEIVFYAPAPGLVAYKIPTVRVVNNL